MTSSAVIPTPTGSLAAAENESITATTAAGKGHRFGGPLQNEQMHQYLVDHTHDGMMQKNMLTLTYIPRTCRRRSEAELAVTLPIYIFTPQILV
jgi:hypothetical protein